MRPRRRLTDHDRVLRDVPERTYMEQIIETAEWLSWLVYHVNDSRMDNPGFPDLMLVGIPTAKPYLAWQPPRPPSKDEWGDDPGCDPFVTDYALSNYHDYPRDENRCYVALGFDETDECFKDYFEDMYAAADAARAARFEHGETPGHRARPQPELDIDADIDAKTRPTVERVRRYLRDSNEARTPAEIAEALDIPLAFVRSVLHRGSDRDFFPAPVMRGNRAVPAWRLTEFTMEEMNDLIANHPALVGRDKATDPASAGGRAE